MFSSRKTSTKNKTKSKQSILQKTKSKFNKFKLSNSVLILLAIVLIIIIFMRLNKRTTYEMFKSPTMIYGNLLVERECDNVSIRGFQFNTDKRELVNNGISTIENQLCEILVDAKSKKRLEAVYLSGIDNYDIYYSQDDNQYMLMNEIRNQTDPTIRNIVDKQGNKVSARFFKISFNSPNSKLINCELYGVNENDEQGINILRGESLAFNEDSFTDYTNSWDSTIGNYFRCVLPENRNHVCNYIMFNGNFQQCKLYVLNLENNTPFILPCNDDLFNCKTNMETTLIYFPNTIHIRELYLVPSDSDLNKIFNINSFKIYGMEIQDNDIDLFRENSSKCTKNINLPDEDNTSEENNSTETFNSTLKEGFTSDSSLINSFNNIEKLCEAIEYQEKIKTESNKVEKHKLYMNKLLEQEEQIKKLGLIIDKLQKQRATREQSNDTMNLAKYQKQKELEAKVIDLVNDRLDNQKSLDVRVNLRPSAN